ncbi:hypothetical protein [Legionella longbeachae]|uniref:Protein kinase domain containing protein n=1 Tax=Legionella longbeachae serogroup 1 (strain NSW150) TaxID=661367 RepID=D3HJX8_LEGLN|nr:hypothetical protein [Legionella longbeachae]VEE03258.1 protein kinase domain containing protein [Legionella oakridgensis]HBD7398570.1 hypothetical protein [Legionella pneumophila]ARB93844.1 hypothetical protein A6J40_17400 [Legionella longbeachae]ARM33016.1 hypothetical protein B0B39_05555 [Legionella longbeachae]EEZ94152.1 conserved hypothetical protein [Legionella longbeachae D-4968]
MSRHLDTPSSNTSKELKKLIELVSKYNEISDEEEYVELKRLFYLQKINYLTQHSTINKIIQWRNQPGKNGLESHLQKYQIHRDSSKILQSIEFANAVSCVFSPLRPLQVTSLTDFYKAMQERDKLFTNDPTKENIAKYIEYNQTIKAYYQQNQQLQEKIQRHMYYLSLAYAKVDAIQGFVHEEFDEYQTEVLGNPKSNNKNFTFNIDGEPISIVIRVEDRHTMGKEQQLQTHQVSEYFSEDYVTIMVPFLNDDDETMHQPVVISEFGTKGDLARYAEKLKGRDPKEISKQTLNFMAKLSDFCTKLMDSGHYHPDIKLSNFLTDGERLIVSDRKTITDKKDPKVNEISTSPAYGAPEYQRCLRAGSIGLNFRAFSTKLDMPSYMSFQVGTALKEFMLKSNLIPFNEESEKDFEQKFVKWQLLSKFVISPPATNEVTNLSLLVQELTRENSKDRLPIRHFQTLLEKVTSSADTFIQEVEKLSPASKLSSYEDLELIRTILTADSLDKNLEEKLGQKEPAHLEKLLQDPRLNSESLFKGNALSHANQYLSGVDKALLEKDLEKSSNFRWFLHKVSFGFFRVPRVSAIEDIKANLPKMNKITQACIFLNRLAGNETFPGLDANKSALFQEISILRQKVEQQAPKDVEKSNRNRLGKSTNSNLQGLLDDICDVIIHDTVTSEACDVIIHDISEKEQGKDVKRTKTSLKSGETSVERPVHHQLVTALPLNVDDIANTIKRGDKIKKGLILIKETVVQETFKKEIRSKII